MLLLFGVPSDRVTGKEVESNLKKGIALANQGEWQEALPYLRRAVQEDKNSATAQTVLGLAALEVGNYAEAESSLSRAVELDPESTRAYYGLGMLYEKMEREDPAIQAWMKFIELAQTDELKELGKKHLKKLQQSAS